MEKERIKKPLLFFTNPCILLRNNRFLKRKYDKGESQIQILARKSTLELEIDRMRTGKTNTRIEILLSILISLVCVTGATGIGWVFHLKGFPETNIVIVYLLSVLLTACSTQSYVYGIAVSIIATCAFNYFFTEPYFTLSVNDPTYFITFSIMTITAIITSTLTSKVKQSVFAAQEREQETSAIYQLTNRLSDASDISEIASIAVSTTSTLLNCHAACLCFTEKGQPEQSFIQQRDNDSQARRKLIDIEETKHRIESLRTAYAVGPEFYDWPIYGRESTLGILRIPKETAKKMNEAQKSLLRSLIESTALAMDRFISMQAKLKSQQETLQERYRGNLLRAISHDLRTPLSGIMGTSEMLMDMTDKDEEKHALAKDIYQDADWLHSLVENILSLTRLQDGKLTLNKQKEAVEEIISVAVAAIAKRSPEYEITVHIPNEVLLVPMDAKLIEQTLVNLLDNAVKHTPLGNEISITVREDKEKALAVFSVADRGSGIAKSDLPHIFQMFFTTGGKGPDAKRGIGLGLAICESIVKAHGGAIEAHNRTDGPGAEFIFMLPMEGTDYDK